MVKRAMSFSTAHCKRQEKLLLDQTSLETGLKSQISNYQTGFASLWYWPQSTLLEMDTSMAYLYLIRGRRSFYSVYLPLHSIDIRAHASCTWSSLCSIPSKYSLGLVFIHFSVHLETSVSNMARPPVILGFT